MLSTYSAAKFMHSTESGESTSLETRFFVSNRIREFLSN